MAAERRNGDGIGGTGMTRGGLDVADGKRNGDGIGGTGILGTISGFGSIIVNGLALEFDRHTPVAVDGKPSSLEELKVGQVVHGVAHTKDGKLTLDHLEIQHAVVGPVSTINHDAETMTVLGQNVKLNLAGDKAAVAAFRTLQAGDTVSVSGLRMEDGTIIASRVDEQAKDDVRVLVRGLAAGVSANGVRIGALDIPAGGGTTITPPTAGGRLFVSGRMINGQFVADLVNGGSALPFDENVGAVSLEGYAGGATAQGAFMVQGITVEGTSLPVGTAAGDRIVVSGRIAGADRIAATAISKVRTVVTINRAKGSLRPAAMRPDAPQRPERVAPRPAIDRPQTSRPPVPERPPIERPQGGPGF